VPKVIVVTGSRNFSDESFVFSVLRKIDFETMYVGDASGVDYIAAKFARENNRNLVVFSANWKEFGRSAGPKRNLEMLKAAKDKNNEDLALLAFPGGKGTANCISLARKLGLKILYSSDTILC
jgi:hypothetical protein